MSVELTAGCERSTSGGKGNAGLFIERDPGVCAAGLPTAQPENTLAWGLQHYILKDEVDSLISDAIIPPSKPRPLPRLRKPQPLDLRHTALNTQVSHIINPPMLTKFQTVVKDFRDTAYNSYWNKQVGKSKDPLPMLPEGFDSETSFGKPTKFHGRLYDIVMPKEPLPDKTPLSKQPSFQKDRNYCKPAYNPTMFFGYRTDADKRGKKAKCCFTDDRVILGTNFVTSSIKANVESAYKPRLGDSLSPNENIKEVPNGYSFGKLYPSENISDCFSQCGVSPAQHFYRKCFKHLNSLRRCLSAQLLPTFFHTLYLNLKYLDKEHSGWLPKDVVYNFCGSKLIRFNPDLIEPLLSLWNAFDGSRVEYKTFVLMINFKQRVPDVPKIPSLPVECLEYRTTYTDMMKPGQRIDDRNMAGLPSGRYMDMDYPVTPEGYCRAHQSCLPQESDVKSCLNPSILTNSHVSHRNMYQVQEPHVVRRVFEATGEEFTDESFDRVWKKAQKYHSKGLVCYETFRRALNNSTGSENEDVML